MKTCNSKPIVKVNPNGDPENGQTVASKCDTIKMKFILLYCILFYIESLNLLHISIFYHVLLL